MADAPKLSDWRKTWGPVILLAVTILVNALTQYLNGGGQTEVKVDAPPGATINVVQK